MNLCLTPIAEPRRNAVGSSEWLGFEQHKKGNMKKPVVVKVDGNGDVLVEVAILVSYIVNQAQNNPHDSIKDIANEALEVSPFGLWVEDDPDHESDEHPYRIIYA